MPIDIAALLLPISADSPAGTDVRYSAITEKIKEARRQEEDISQGVWKHEIKTANFPIVLKLSTEVLTKQSKDLQVAAWMTEALASTEGLDGLRQGLELVRGLLENFWDSVYPQIEDDDLDLRAMPLSWLGSQLGGLVRSSPILKGGYNWYHHRSSRAVPTEEQAASDPQKQAARNEALTEGETSPEDFQTAFNSTPLVHLKACYEQNVALVEYLESLNEYCKERFADQSPDFGPLRATLEEVGGVIRVLFKQKEAIEGPTEAAPELPAAEEQLQPVYFPQGQTAESVSAPAPRRQHVSTSAEPVSADDAIQRILTCARYLRREEPYSPSSYLLIRALRWAEFRGAQGSQEICAAPSSQLRMELKRLGSEGAWEALREAAESAAAEPCGRAWLDLHRYAVDACRYSGCYAPANAIIVELRALIAEFPTLPSSMLADDTPAANPETLAWLATENVLPQANSAAATPPAEEWKFAPEPRSVEENTSSPTVPDSYELAMEAARSGRIEEAIETLSLEISREQSGRARFIRRTQLAQVCLASGNETIGRPVLQDLSEEVSARGLEGWEAGELISQPLALLYRCLDGEDLKAKEELYARICKIDPLRALHILR